MKKIFNIALLSVFCFEMMLSTPTVQADDEKTAFNPTSAFSSAPCMISLPAGVLEGQDVICGYVTVPERRADPTGKQIQLAVMVIRSQQPNPEPDPIFMLQGGPGGSTIDTYSQLLLGPTATFAPNRDIVLFDQRGTLYSKPALTCDELYILTISTLDTMISDDEYENETQKALSACRTRLKSEGVNLSAYNSLENAADVEDVRNALGYDEINLYGVSYGTLLALRTIDQFPDHIRSVTLDSVVPPQTNFLLDAPKSQNRAFNVFFKSCATDDACRKAYPDLEKTFFSEVEKLDATPARITLTDPDTQKTYPARLRGEDLQNLLFQMLYSTELIPLLPRLIHGVQQNQFSLAERFESLLVFDQSMSYGMYYSVICSEESDFSIDDFDLQGVQPEIAKTAIDTPESIQQECRIWDVDPLPDTTNQPVISDIPSLVLSGEFDPITPPSYADLVAANLSHAYRVNFPTGGHGAVTSGSCQNQIFLDFLDHPTQPPDTTCLAENQKVEFRTPQNTLFLPSLISLLNLEPSELPWLVFFTISLFLCCSSILVYPVSWLIRKIRREDSSEKPFSEQLLPWLVILFSLVAIAFCGVIMFAAIQMAIQNQMVILVGLPKSWSLLFLLPVLLILLALWLWVCIGISWKNWARLNLAQAYNSLMVVSTLATLVVLAHWGMLTVLIFNH